MKVKELIEILQQKNQEAEVLVGATNDERMSTYAVADAVLEFEFSDIYPDLFNTPGSIDQRLWRDMQDESTPLIYIDTKFGI